MDDGPPQLRVRVSPFVQGIAADDLRADGHLSSSSLPFLAVRATLRRYRPGEGEESVGSSTPR